MKPQAFGLSKVCVCSLWIKQRERFIISWEKAAREAGSYIETIGKLEETYEDLFENMLLYG